LTYVILDLYCGAGGAAQGYADAGFEVVGVDNKPQKHYPFDFIEADALETLKEVISGDISFDAIHASPPCQAWSAATQLHRKNGITYPELIEPTRFLLRRTGLSWVIENVEKAPLKNPVILCGSQFGLKSGDFYLKRHRGFETNWPLPDVGPHDHSKESVSIAGHGAQSHERKLHGNIPIVLKRQLMEIDWMTRDEMGQAIPPAYTRYIGTQLMHYLEKSDAA
jgi:DNA (cytosine-5)-methyltransferase 1